MARTAVLAGVAALAGLGIYVALPDDEPTYIGDLPSMMQQAESAATPAQPEPPRPPAPVGPPVDPPSPVEAEVPAAPGGGPGERVPAPVNDAPPDFRAGSAAGGDEGPNAGLLDFLDGLPLDGALLCIGTDTITRPGIGVIDCLTGEILIPEVPELPELPDCLPPDLITDCIPVEVPLP